MSAHIDDPITLEIIQNSLQAAADEMFAAIHEMRKRIVKSPAFSGEKVIGAILFERTMDGDIDGKPSADFLWEDCSVVPFLKVDKGLADEADGVQIMKPLEGLEALLKRAAEKNVFGTKMRSVINAANPHPISSRHQAPMQAVPPNPLFDGLVLGRICERIGVSDQNHIFT